MDLFVVLVSLYIVSLEKSRVLSSKVTLREENVNSTVSREKRFLFPPYVPYESGPSIEVAVQIPVDDGRGDVYISYCISSGYGQGEYDNPDGIQPPPFQTIYEARKRKTRNAILTRKRFYQIFSEKLKQHGFNGHQCLFKAICEASQSRFENVNGVLGDIVHILFTPTTSRDEELPSKYYEAEMNGQLNLCNHKYTKCPISVFDLITMIK